MKNKFVAAVLAFPFGFLGVHRFYLGQRFLGALYLMTFVFTMIISVEENVPAVAFAFMLPFIDAILFYAMPKADFDDRYNRKRMRGAKKMRRKPSYERTYDFERPAPRTSFAELKRLGIEAFRDHEYEEAADFFLDALEEKPDDKATHFNLACTYSLLRERDLALDHLDQAVAYGFEDFDKIYTHDALSYLRSFKEFDAFVDNDFQLPAKTKQANNNKRQPSLEASDQLELPPIESDNLLDKIIQLGELRDQGILTEEEFDLQKRKILSGE
jgi:tetratricopeptide (TPR) repeat protein